MKTFLQLVNLVRREAGEAGADLVTLAGTLTDDQAQFKNWVREEWTNLQARHSDWKFLRSSFEFDTVAGQRYYTANQAKATDTGLETGSSILGVWKLDSFRVSTSGSSYSDEGRIDYQDYDSFRDQHEMGPARTQQARVGGFTVRPNDSALGFSPLPDAAYTVTGEFYRSPQDLAADTDVPLMPGRYHDLIAYLALKAYGVFMSAPEVIGRADDKIGTLELQLIADQLPSMTTGAPLA